MSHVRGPFIEYECVKCGNTVQANAPRNSDRLDTLVMELNSTAGKRVCAVCFDWSAPNVDRKGPQLFSEDLW